MSAEKIECAEKRTVLKIATYAAAYVASLVASVFGAALATGLTYELTYYRTLNDKISFYVFLTIVPLSFIFLAWVVTPRAVRIFFRITGLR